LEEVELWKDQDFVSDNGRRQYVKASAMSEDLDESELNVTDTFYTQKTGKVSKGVNEPYEKNVKINPGSSDPYIDDEELDLSEILAELEVESQLEEAKEKGKKKKEDEETEDEMSDEEEAEPTKVKDMTNEELIDLIKSIVQQEIESEENETASDETNEPEHAEMDMSQMGMEPSAGNEEEININELLAELEEMYGGEEKESLIEEIKNRFEKIYKSISSIEYNINKFDVQRKIGARFETVGTVMAKNSPIGSSYSFNEYNNASGTTEYRLKIVENDNISRYSAIKTLKGIKGADEMDVYPMPSKGNVTIRMNEINNRASVEIINLSGSVVKKISNNPSNVFQFNDLQNGFYIVKYTNNLTGKVITKKLMVVR
jgi:hypothetical protein